MINKTLPVRIKAAMNGSSGLEGANTFVVRAQRPASPTSEYSGHRWAIAGVVLHGVLYLMYCVPVLWICFLLLTMFSQADSGNPVLGFFGFIGLYTLAGVIPIFTLILVAITVIPFSISFVALRMLVGHDEKMCHILKRFLTVDIYYFAALGILQVFSLFIFLAFRGQ